MEVNSTEHFNDRFRRYTGKKIVASRLKHILKTIDALPTAWLPQFDHIRKCAVKQTFSDEIGKGDRLIVTHQPPITLLDLGEHDPTYRRWTVGETPETVQISRLERRRNCPSLFGRLLKLGGLLDIDAAKRIFDEPEPKVAQQWLRFLSDEQMDLVDEVLERLRENQGFEFHIILGGAGTGKTQVLLLLASELHDAGEQVGYFTTPGVRRMVTRAGLDMPRENLSSGSIHLLDDPVEVGQVVKALDRARSCGAKALVVAVDPFQWTERTAFLKLSLILGDLKGVGELQGQSLQGVWHKFYDVPRYSYFLKTAYRQTRRTGAGSLDLSASIFQRMNPYVREDKKRRFEEITQPFVERVLNGLQHSTEGGLFRIHEEGTSRILWEAVARVAARQDRWSWTEPILFVYDDKQGQSKWLTDSVVIPGISDQTNFDTQSTVQSVLAGLNTRLVKYLNPSDVRGQEFQDVIICIGKSRWDQFKRAKIGLDGESWKSIMPIHTFTTRAVDSVEIIVRG